MNSLSTCSTVQGRLGEYAILQANGLGRGIVLRSLAVEETLLVVLGGMTLPEDEQVVEELAACCAHKSLGE
jgi:hypothetical protein